MGAIKEQAKKLIDALPDHVTWDDIMYEFYVKQKLGAALKEAAEGKVVPHEKAKEQLFSK